VLYLNLLPSNSKLLSLVFLNPALLETNLKSKLENTIKPFRIHLDYWRLTVKVINNYFKEEKEIK